MPSNSGGALEVCLYLIDLDFLATASLFPSIGVNNYGHGIVIAKM